VEHDAAEIWDAVCATLAELTAQLTEPIAGIGITNQRETVVAWDRRTGQPRHRAIVWQDRRTADRCEALGDHLPTVRRTTGLVLDPYFSGTKFAWLVGQRAGEGGVAIDHDLALGTIDAWLVWKLTGQHATDPSNASRTMLYDIGQRRWSDEMADLLGVPLGALPTVMPSSGRIGLTVDGLPIPAGIPVSGIAGDQQSALFGQACIEPGMCKNTYGTGSFVLLNVGDTCPEPTDGMLTTVAWELADGTFTYALEGAIFVTGAAIQWLRDGLGVISESSEIGPLAESVPDSNGAFVVPAFTGLGSPWWDPYARGTIVGITRGVTKAHLARAVVEAMALQTRDVLDAMSLASGRSASGRSITELRVDGGASVMDLLCQLQADQLGVTVRRSAIAETTALGAAYLAGLAEGVWSSTAELAATWRADLVVEPNPDRTVADLVHGEWRRAVERALGWAAPGHPLTTATG
jgi:glycerol kinase